MSDLACWRIGELDSGQVVVRIRGCEFRLDDDDALELCGHISTVIDDKARESLGAEYQELENEVPPVRIDLATALGLKREIPRRKFP